MPVVVGPEAPLVAGNVADTEVYAQAELQQHFGFRCYVGHPIHDGRGELCGALCGFDPQPQSIAVEAMIGRVRAACQVITTHLAHEELIEDTRRRAERAGASGCE